MASSSAAGRRSCSLNAGMMIVRLFEGSEKSDGADICVEWDNDSQDPAHKGSWSVGRSSPGHAALPHRLELRGVLERLNELPAALEVEPLEPRQDLPGYVYPDNSLRIEIRVINVRRRLVATTTNAGSNECLWCVSG